MEQLSNFRDMGGVQTIDVVKEGLLFRCGALADATATDIATLQTMNIKTVIDYRDDVEAEKQPSPILPGVKMTRIPARKDTTDAMKRMSMEEVFSNQAVL